MSAADVAEHLKKADAYERQAVERLRPKLNDYAAGSARRSTRAAEAQALATLALSHRTAAHLEFLPGRVA